MKYRVYDITSGEDRYILDLSVTSTGMEFEGHDLGKTVETFFGRDEYEYWMKLDKRNMNKLLAQLKSEYGRDLSVEEILKNKFNDVNATQILREICKDHNIELQFYSWP